MSRLILRYRCALLLIVLSVGRATAAEKGFENWNLEPSVTQAHLVMVARLTSIGSLTVVEGAKTDVMLREYRFQPVRRLKGIFQRDQLSMTNVDLGCPAEDPVQGCPLKEGEFRLLILVQQQGLQGFGCVSATPGATTFEQLVPLLSGPDDPLVDAVDTLIQVADARSRHQRAKLLLDRLQTTSGPAAVPLLSSLKMRADCATSDPRTLPTLAKLMSEGPEYVRSAALGVLRDVLNSHGAAEQPLATDSVREALQRALVPAAPNGGEGKSAGAVTHATRTSDRLAAIDALGELLGREVDVPWARPWLLRQLTSATTYDERAAAATALAHVNDPDVAAAVRAALAALPLDEVPARESVYARAAEKLDAEKAAVTLVERLNRSIVARQSLAAEIESLGRMRVQSSLAPMLLAAQQADLALVDRLQLVAALGQLRDDAAVPALIGWMRDRDGRLQEAALAALENIDSPVAAREVRPLLKTEPFLPHKLRIARLLARHKIDDGYALATEHLADAAHTAQAILVLAALDDPRTSRDLSEIVAERPDRRWYAVTLGALAAIGNAEAQQQLLGVLRDDRHPLVTAAAEAAGLTDDDKLLAPLARLTQSRNKQIALASILALHRYLSNVRSSPHGLAVVRIAPDSFEYSPPGSVAEEEQPRPVGDEATAIFDAVAALAVDSYVEIDVRRQALAVARLVDKARYAELLERLADQADLEGSPMLAEVIKERDRLSN
ncbi:MAG TPA: hypothetical protein VHD36_20635 [Pirellulales bacterium]|nr:hypothetical protein [Pirellulales bacterium]